MESKLRLKGRLGRLKGLGIILGLVGLVLLIAELSLLPEALANDPHRPMPVEVGQLVRGEIPTSRYVSVSGQTTYDIFYTEEVDDGTVKGRYYYLVDDALANIVLVKAQGMPIGKPQLVPATIAGMTHSTESGLKDLIRSDLAEITDAGLQTNIDLYIAEGQKPLSIGTVLVLLVLGVALLALGGVSLAFPGVVFGPAPLEPAVAPAVGETGAQASGTFLKLKSIQPLEVGRGTRKFENAVANLIPQPDRRLLVYIHHIVTMRAYGIKVGRRESHWGAFVGQDNVVSVEPGKLYGWRERPAVRLRYRDAKGKEQDLVVSFNHAAAQAGFVEMLRQMGFAVGSGLAAM